MIKIDSSFFKNKKISCIINPINNDIKNYLKEKKQGDEIMKNKQLICCTLLSILMFGNLLAKKAFSDQKPEYFGDPNFIFDESKYDENYPDMKEWAKAGVKGGIPYRGTLPIIARITTKDNIQKAIDQANPTKPSVILLANGIYTITNSVKMKSKIILQGTDKNKTIINVNMRQKWKGWGRKKIGIYFRKVNYAGLENLTVRFDSGGIEPVDNKNYSDKWRKGMMNNDVKRDDFYVALVKFREATNCWVDDCMLLNSGTDPVITSGNDMHLTFRNNFVDRAHNKGAGGNGYFTMRGQYTLICGNTIKRLRHFAIEVGAKYCVVVNNKFEVDVNFHQRDKGHNLVEGNSIRIPEWHRHAATHSGWAVFAAGGSIHGATGPGNRMFNNTSDLRNSGPRFANPDTVYKTQGKSIRVHSTTPPKHGTLYAVKLDF